MATERSAGLLLVGIGALPLVGGALLARIAPGGGLPLPCPFRALTGWPCPFCGATRAFTALGRGDLTGVVEHNAVWAAVAIVAVLVGALALVAAARGRRPTARLLASRGRWPVVLATVAVAWAWAIAQRATIVG